MKLVIWDFVLRDIGLEKNEQQKMENTYNSIIRYGLL